MKTSFTLFFTIILSILFAFSVSAEPLPERDIINDSITIIDDRNILSESISGNLDEDGEFYLEEIIGEEKKIEITKGGYILSVILPVIICCVVSAMTSGLIMYYSKHKINKLSSED